MPHLLTETELNDAMRKLHDAIKKGDSVCAHRIVNDICADKVVAIVELEFARSYCCTEKFTINGIKANYDDFGSGRDEDLDAAPEYGCGNKVFSGELPTTEVLNKYNITVEDYAKIVEKLEEGLSFGCCEWCR